MFGTKASRSRDIRSDWANRWHTPKKDWNNHQKDSKMCKTKLVLSEAWAEFSPAQRKKRWRRKKSYTPAGGGGLQVRRGKNPRQRESLDNDKDKTDSATTNKQDPQDTPAGRRILCGIVSYILLRNYIYTTLFLAFYLSFNLTFYLAFYLTSYLT